MIGLSVWLAVREENGDTAPPTTQGCVKGLLHPGTGRGKLPDTSGEIWRAKECPIPGRNVCPHRLLFIVTFLSALHINHFTFFLNITTERVKLNGILPYLSGINCILLQ